MFEPDAYSERRWATRHRVDFDVELTDSCGLSYTGEVINISEDGCSVRLSSQGHLVRNRLHTIKIMGLEPLTAYVIWSSEGKAGLNLSKPLEAAIVQLLAMNPPSRTS